MDVTIPKGATAGNATVEVATYDSAMNLRSENPGGDHPKSADRTRKWLWIVPVRLFYLLGESLPA